MGKLPCNFSTVTKIKNGITDIKNILTNAKSMATSYESVKRQAKKSEKTLSTKGKVFAGVAGVAVFALNVFKANLNANSKKADVDHRWQTGHNRV